MVSKDDLKNGILRYIDSELIPKMPQSSKWIIGAFIVLASSKYDSIFDKLYDNQILRLIGVFDDNGMVDVDKLAGAFMASADKYGKMRLNIPAVGVLSFSSEDIDTLRSFIETEDVYD